MKTPFFTEGIVQMNGWRVLAVDIAEAKVAAEHKCRPCILEKRIDAALGDSEGEKAME